MVNSSQHAFYIAGWRVHFEIKHLLMFNVQLCLIFERFSVTLKFPLHSAIVTIVQKSSAYGYAYYSSKIVNLVQRAVALLVPVRYSPVFLKYFPT